MEKDSPGLAKSQSPEEFKEKEFGKVVSSFDLILSDAEGYAKVFAEGSPALERLLMHLWGNGIETIGCCVGHVQVAGYERFTLRGSIESVDLEIGRKRSWLPWYRPVYEEEPGYFYLSHPTGGDEQRVFVERLTEALVGVPSLIDVDGQRVRVAMPHYAPEDVEDFFAAVSDALSDAFGIAREMEAGSRNSELKESFDGVETDDVGCGLVVDEVLNDAYRDSKATEGELDREPNAPAITGY